MDTNTIIYTLIEHSLKRDTFKFDATNEKELTQRIFENGLVGLLFESIDPSSFKMTKYYQMLKQAFGSFVSKDIQQQAIIGHLKTLFNDHKIQHIFLKGTHLKSLYPESYMLGMGDMDVVVPLKQFKEAQKMLIEAGYQFKSATSHHHVYESVDGNFIELHQSITSSNEYENEAFLKDLWEHVTLKDQFTYQLKPEFEYVYLLTHLVRHIRTSGVGIRSLLDIQIFYKAYQSIIDETILNGYLKTYELETFNDKVVRLNNIFTNQLKPNEEDLNIIDFIMKSGIHGTGSDHDLYLNKRAHEQSRLKKSKFRYILGEVFPSRHRIQETYPYLKKYPWLLPWAWMVRLLKQLFKVKNTKKRIQSVTSDDNIDRVKDVYDYLGL